MQAGIEAAVLLVIMVCTSLVTAYVVKRRDEEQLERYQDKIYKKQRDEVQSIYETMRGWRHDYHNHMQKMKAHLALGQIKEVEGYLNQLEEDLDTIDFAVRTGNVTVDAILSSKLSVAEKRDIEVNCKAQVPEKLMVSDIDLCVVIGNLIDNGIESCDKQETGEQRFLRVYIGVFRKQLYISVSNTTTETIRKFDYEYISQKRGNHGHGLKRISRIVEKYGGYMNRKNEPGIFVTEVMLPL